MHSKEVRPFHLADCLCKWTVQCKKHKPVSSNDGVRLVLDGLELVQLGLNVFELVYDDPQALADGVPSIRGLSIIRD